MEAYVLKEGNVAIAEFEKIVAVSHTPFECLHVCANGAELHRIYY